MQICRIARLTTNCIGCCRRITAFLFFFYALNIPISIVLTSENMRKSGHECEMEFFQLLGPSVTYYIPVVRVMQLFEERALI